ncbi:MAG: hypothetical protein SCARUB_04942 [Candidatus Scalindua rubra]|uniref:DUF262 domain-containing protein n=1 Tax=Candidatus Scalindua rubra TaxID=1872076 RepID=A0A1E3X4Q8_9BACT|nr:MAG: hypothetical protein SCARUB_04942 [Candidatus Scalindua rubra]
MIAREVNYLKFLRDPKQFIVPIYQRTYSWTTKECKQLWKDIVRIANGDDIPAHFIGSIVYIEKGIYQVAAVSQLLLIDGQQRLTTLSLLLFAIANAIEDGQQVSGLTNSKIKNYYLFNNEETDDLFYKLHLTRTDKETFWNLLKNNDLPDKYSFRIQENYQFFVDKIDKSKISLEDLIRGIQKLVIVDISLDRDHDNPQLIFESLNSTGLDLSQADLIRNYILMGLEPEQQKHLYESYWYMMEQDFGQANYTKHFDRFMRDYLTLKSKAGTIPTLSLVYEAFKIYSNQDGVPIEEIVRDIYHFSKHFTRLLSQKEDNSVIHTVLQDIDVLKVDVSYPFLMEVFEDYNNGQLEESDLLTILLLVESYVFRRAICGIPTNSLNKTFATFTRSIMDKENYLESVTAKFLLLDSYRRFPNDEEFKQGLLTRDVYNFRSRNYLLRKLENFERKEKVQVDDYTIEHIMPQNENLSDDWKRDLGNDWQSVHSRYLHTIGNLTLTGYNPELSDRPFLEKRNMDGGFADSPIRLNRGLADLQTWNEESIINRTNTLANKAVKIWGMPELIEDVLEQYRKEPEKAQKTKYTIEDHSEYLKGEILDLFNLLRRRVLNLDPTVKEEFKKLYIAYKTTTNFVDIVPQRSRLRLSLNMVFDEINDPKGICKNVANLGRWGNGDVEVGFTSPIEIDYVMFLIQQSFDQHSEDIG